ncbi:MAG TPA: hypothetical protein VFV38_15145 [Ktedonobacteraceae bacterium]|nr:hypothetical protein [Ktedonobacteraceae bacterium]
MMVSPQIEMRLRARYHALDQILGLLEEIKETPDTLEDQQVFTDVLMNMERESRELALSLPDEALYYHEQETLFHEVSTWPTGEGLQTTIATSDHRFCITSAGIQIYEASSDEEMEQRSPADAQELQFAEMLVLVDHIQARYAAFVHAQAHLQHTWRTVADEVIEALEAQAPGYAREATGQDIQNVLHTLGPLTFTSASPTDSFAGRWYQSLWLPEETATFTQEWVPFLRVFRQRRMERFPSMNQQDSFDGEEKESAGQSSPEKEIP